MDIDIYKEINKELLLRSEAEISLYSFMSQAWPEVEGEQFVGGWYLEALCEHLEALYRGDIRKLLINVPPRTTKSITCSAMFPSWVWLHSPEKQFLCVSHSRDLAEEACMKHRYIVSSDWYKVRWGDKFQLMPDQNQKSKFANNRSGVRNSLSILSRLTGKNANFLIIDDANNAVESDEERAKKNMRYSAVLSTRLNNPESDRILIVAQRTNMIDLSGYTLEKDSDFIHLMLPLEFEKARKCKTIVLPSSAPKVWEDPRKEEKEPLCNIRFNKKAIDNLKKGLGSSYLIAGQLQQRPSPEEGGMFKKSWFQWWKKEKPPEVFQIIQSWDTGFKKEDKRKPNQKISYSACTTWGVFDDEFGIANIILLNLWRDRVEFPELRAMAKKLAEDYRYTGSMQIKEDGRHVPDMILIESKATGDPLNQELRRAGIQTTMFDPTPYGDKIRRASLITHIVQAGRVWVPARGPYYQQLTSFSEIFVECCANFPNDDESKDVVDTLSQVLHKLLKGSIIRHPTDPKFSNKKPEIVHYGVK